MTALLVALPLAVAGNFTPGAFSATGPMPEDYFRILSRFPIYAEQGWHEGYGGRGDLGWFGSGQSNENGQRTLANFILVYALLGTDPRYDASVSGVPAAELRRKAGAALRYWAATHSTGSLPCTDDKPWGHHWQSSWWTGKAMTGATLLGGRLSPVEWSDLRRVLADEADHLTSFPVPVGEYADTKSEENAWYSEALAWAVTLLPDHPSAPRWLERYHEFCMNTLSVARDAEDGTMVEGRPVRAWYRGPNVHADYTIENHGFFHICYQSCPLHSLAWNCYAFRRAGRIEPETTHHHVRDVYRTLLRFHLWDGRFAYLGGKDWPRYAYGLYFMVPGLVVQQVVHGDAVARAIESRRVATFEREQCLNADGSFFSRRFTLGTMTGWPSEWETDCACMLSMAYLLHEQAGSWLTPASREAVDRACNGELLSPEAEQVSSRTATRFAGVSWKALGGPVELVLATPETVHMLEWQGCGGSAYAVEGADGTQVVRRHLERTFDRGFSAYGELALCYVAPDRPVDPAWRLELSDATTRCDEIAAPEHPVLHGPWPVPAESLPGLECLDSVSAAGDGWETIVRDDRGRPALFEGRIGEGAVLVCMASVEKELAEGRPAGNLLLNALAWLGARGPSIAWVRAEETGRQALGLAGVEIGPVRWGTLDAYDGLFIDKSSGPDLEKHWPEVVEFIRRGGRVFKLCLQDSGWSPDLFGGHGKEPTLRGELAVVALPDDPALVRIERTSAVRAVTVTRAEGLRWRVANDLLNDNTRTLTSGRQTLTVEGVTPEGTVGVHRLAAGAVTIDGALTLASVGAGPGFTLIDQPERRFSIGRSLCAEDLLCPYWDRPTRFEAGEAVAETALLLAANGGQDTTGLLADRGARLARNEAGVAMLLRSAAGRAYAIGVRWASAPEAAPMPALPYGDASYQPALPALAVPGLRGGVRLTDLADGRSTRYEMGDPMPLLEPGAVRTWRISE